MSNLLLQVETNSTYKILLFFVHSLRLMIRNVAVSIGVLNSKDSQMGTIVINPVVN